MRGATEGDIAVAPTEEQLIYEKPKKQRIAKILKELAVVRAGETDLISLHSTLELEACSILVRQHPPTKSHHRSRQVISCNLRGMSHEPSP
jgi:hypothetical protein